MAPAPAIFALSRMRRFLIGLTLTLLLIISIGIGIAVARWPEWRHLVFCGLSPRLTPHSECQSPGNSRKPLIIKDSGCQAPGSGAIRW